MAQRHAEFFEIGAGQFRQDFRVDFALAKDCLILAEAKATEPIPPRPRVNPDKGKAIIAHPTQPVEGG